MAEGIRKAERPDSPNRCQASTGNGQCLNEAMEGCDYCKVHGGHSLEHISKRQYNVAKWQARLSRFTDHADVKNLTEELGILRLTLETILNRCENDNDLIMRQSAISGLVMDITKLVTSATQVEQKMGLYVDKKTILQFASEVIDIIATELEDQPARVQAIAERIADGFERT